MKSVSRTTAYTCLIMASLYFSGCISAISVFNHKSVIHSRVTRKSLNELAQVGYVVSAIPVSAVGIFLIASETDDTILRSGETGELIIACAILIALPFIIADLLIAKLIHKILYDEDYEFELLGS